MIYTCKDIMEKNCCPRSLVAYAAEEVAKAYKFVSQDAFSFVRNIDYHPMYIDGLLTEYEIVSDRKIKQFDGREKDRFFITLNRFLINRKYVMKVMLNHLAKMVVNFTSTEEVNETNLKEIRAQYVASNKAQDELETIGIKLHLENNIENLLSQIQQERTRAKLMNLFVNQSYMKYGETVEDVHRDLGNHFPMCTKTEESLNDTATSTCAGIVTEGIYAEVGNDTALERDIRSENTQDKEKSNENLEKHGRQQENVDGISEEGIITHKVESNANENLMGNTHIVTATNIGIKRLDRLDEVSNDALEDEDEGEGNDLSTKKILGTASENGWTDDEENDEDNFVLYGMMNYRPD